MDKKELEQVRNILEFGPVMPHPTWTKELVSASCHTLYDDVILLRRFILERLIKDEDNQPKKLLCPDCGAETDGHRAHHIPGGHGEMCHTVKDRRGGWRKLGDYTG